MKNLNHLKLFLVILIVYPLIIWADVRKPAKAGTWYPADADKLRKVLDGFFSKVELPDEKKSLNPRIIVSPHAGITYSGQVAAYGYSLVKEKKFDTVILLGPSHHHMKNVISVYSGKAYETPLGSVPIDRDMAEKIKKLDKKVVSDHEIHKNEHSIEIQIPFLQHVLKKGFSVLPVLVSSKNRDLLRSFAKKLSKVIKNTEKDILIVVSTDFSHFHPYDKAKDMDMKTAELILKNKSGKLMMNIKKGSSEMCGYYPWIIGDTIANIMGWDGRHFLKYMNSGDISKISTPRGVVGYHSIVITEDAPDSSSVDKKNLTEKNRKKLLKIARKSIIKKLEKKGTYEPEKPDDKYLSKERAVFVTLNKDGKLRGCMGQLQAALPLYKAVNQMALSAAFKDRRFAAVKKEELEDINIEISVLTPLEKVDSYEKIVMKKHGVVVRKGNKSGVFLPQVAQDTEWDRKTFLENLCSQKAGLPKEAYKKDDVELLVFRVIKFSE